MSTDISELLSSIYYDTKNSASFGGIEKLYNEGLKSNPTITRKQVKDWLSGELVYTLHKPVLKKFKRNRIVVERIDQQWEADLVDMQEFSEQNDNYNFILTIIDCFSKYAFAQPLINKTGNQIINALKIIFKEKKCTFLRTDRGTEFCNQNVRAFLNREEVHHFTTHDKDVKCAIVERFNRTLKAKMFKYFTSVGNRRYIDELQNFITSYNNSYHRSIKMRPIDVTKKNEKLVFKNLYGVSTLREVIMNRINNTTPKIKSGDKVRKKYPVKPFDKGYYPNWSDQVFTIEKVIKGDNQPVFVIKDYSGKIIQQKFYPQDLQKITENLYRIEKIIKTRTRNNKKQYFVKWLNYPDTYNSWVEDIESLK